MIDIPRAECQHLINRWRKDANGFKTRAYYEEAYSPKINALLDMASVKEGCARALEIVLETVDAKYAT